jgi:hypothetical protein
VAAGSARQAWKEGTYYDHDALPARDRHLALEPAISGEDAQSPGNDDASMEG